MERFLEAMYFATNKHLLQKRKDGITPYISHCLAVSVLLSKLTNDENVIIAGILHDTLEDTNTIENEIKKMFGEKVLNLVLECTEQNPGASWQERKQAVLKRIPILSNEAALIKSADLLHNTYEIVQKVKENGIIFFNNFNAGAEDKLKYDNARLKLLKEYHNNILLVDIERNINTLKKLI